MAISLYSSWDRQYKSPFGAVSQGTQIQFTIKPNRSFGTVKAILNLQREEGEILQIPLVWVALEGACDVYTCTVAPQECGLYWYSFALYTAKGLMFVTHTENGLGELTDHPPQPWQLTVYDAAFTTPDWFKGGVLYQIFPDRFCKVGEFPANVPKDRDLRLDWGGLPEYKSFETQTNMNNDYFGGNLEGVSSKLDYLETLGVTVLYLNPIFEAHSNHRYNTADYLKIDPLLGDESDFAELCLEAKKRNIHILLDGVFNHTGDDSIYFNRYGRYPGLGAYQSQESLYSGWYDFTVCPDKYRCWWGDRLLPEVNEANESYQEFIFGEQGVLKHWLKAGAAGWRLDVADELPAFFLNRLRETVKGENPDAVIIGEVWEDASNKMSYGKRTHYLEGKQLDSVMNYPFKEAIIAFMKEHRAEALHHSIMNILEHYPKPVVDMLMNILGTHDTVRIITRLVGQNGEGRDRAWKAGIWLTEEERGRGLQAVAIATAINFFLPGVPCLYYGDEIGLEGYEDPFNRRCFLWEETDGWLPKWIQKLAHIRHRYDCFKSGDYLVIVAEGGHFAFIRKGVEQDFILAVNLEELPFALSVPYPVGEITLLADLKESMDTELLMIAPNSCKIFVADSIEKAGDELI